MSGNSTVATMAHDLLTAVEQNDVATIQRLVESNSNLLNHIYPDYNRAILLIACSLDNVQGKTIDALLKNGAQWDDCRSDNHWQAIHFAADINNYEALKVLLEYCPGCVNAIEQYGCNALHLLNPLQTSYIKCVELLIKKGVDVLQLNANLQSPLEKIRNVADDELVRKVMKIVESNMLMRNKNDIYANIMEYLRDKNQEKCIEEIDKLSLDSLSKCLPGSTFTLLQQCARYNLYKILNHLLDKGVDPTIVTSSNPTPPIIITASMGYTSALERLLKEYDIGKLPSNLLIDIVRYIDDERIDFSGCYKVVMDKLKKIGDSKYEVNRLINGSDGSLNTTLHYAVWFATPDIIEELLGMGAYLGAKNIYGYTPLDDIDPEVLEKHFDESIICDCLLNRYDEKFEIRFNYKSILQQYGRDFLDNDGEVEKGGDTNGRTSSETEVIFSMANSQDLRPLLKHPVIVSFLALKWNQYHGLFWANFFTYLSFAVLLMLHIFIDYAITIENCVIHPLLLLILRLFLNVTVVVFTIRELFQVCMNPAKYFQSIDNWLEVLLLSITYPLMLDMVSSMNAKRQLWSLAIILLSFELIIMLGKHPYFSTKVVMFRTVARNFFCAFFTYFLLIVAFALSFFTLFNTKMIKSGTPMVNTNNTNIDEGEDGSFSNIGRSIFKTIVMLTGEFDSASLDFTTLFVVSKLIFLFFIFVIHLILLNLLNGLAVSDTGVIREEAELFGYIARAQHVNKIETLSLGNILPNCIKIKIKKIIEKMFGSRSLAWLTCGRCELTFFPNKSVMRGKTGEMIKLNLNSDTIRKIHEIIHKKKRKRNKISN